MWLQGCGYNPKVEPWPSIHETPGLVPSSYSLSHCFLLPRAWLLRPNFLGSWSMLPTFLEFKDTLSCWRHPPLGMKIPAHLCYRTIVQNQVIYPLLRAKSTVGSLTSPPVLQTSVSPDILYPLGMFTAKERCSHLRFMAENLREYRVLFQSLVTE